MPVETEQAVDLLCLSMNQATLSPGVVVGSDLGLSGHRSVAMRDHWWRASSSCPASRKGWSISVVLAAELRECRKHTSSPRLCRTYAGHYPTGERSRESRQPRRSLRFHCSKGSSARSSDWFVRSAADSSNVSAGKSGKSPGADHSTACHDQWLHSLENA